MARDFDRTATEYLKVTSAVVATPPFSMACWFYSITNAWNQSLLSIADKDAALYHSLAAGGQAAGDPVVVRTYDGGISDALTTTGYSDNTWHHALGVWAADNDRAAYIDGGSKGTNAANRPNVANVDCAQISGTADSTPIWWMDGLIAEAAIWDTALNGAEAILLASGCPPPFIRPQNLVYYPLLDGNDSEWHRRYDMTAHNTPGIANHPPRVVAFWQKYRMRAVSTQGPTPLVSWGRLNVWNIRARSPVVARIPRPPAAYNSLAIY